MVYKVLLESLTHVLQPFDKKTKNDKWRYFQKTLRYHILNTVPSKARGTHQAEPQGLPKMPATEGIKMKCRGGLLIGWVGSLHRKGLI